MDIERFTSHGLECAIRKNNLGALCGYVAVAPEHPLYGMHYSDCIKSPPKQLIEREIHRSKIDILALFAAAIRDTPAEEECELSLLFDVHGGITYSGPSVPGSKPDGLWWFGFDCAHAGDFVAGLFPDGAVRDEEFVTRECE